jgi:hypothetical protein
MNNPSVGWLNPVEELERYARASGPILQSALDELLNVHSKYFRQVGPNLVHVAEGNVPMADWVANLRKTRPHMYADWNPDITEDQIRQEIIDDATLRPSPKNVGRLFKEFGELRAKAILEQAGTDWVRMKPGNKVTLDDKGNAKGSDPTPEQKSLADRRANPWSAEGWNITKQGQVLKSLGPEKAAAIARAANSYIGATRPTKH